MAKTMADRAKASRSHMAKVNGENFVDKQNNTKNRNYRNPSNYNQQSNNGNSFGNKRVKSIEPVSVPYNFIGLPKQVIPAEFFELNSYSAEELKELYRQHVLDNGKNSGYIDIDILTQTPLFIGGKVITKGNQEYQEFFGGIENPIIPGSSIKSMIKQILKITTASKFNAYDSKTGIGDFEDKRLYFRGLASPVKELRKHYDSSMVENVTENGKQQSLTKAKAGFLIKTIKNECFIVNANFKILLYKNYPELSAKKNRASIEWQDQSVNIHTGSMNRKASFVQIAKPGNFKNRSISVPESVINSYIYDSNRTTLNLLDIENGKSGSEAKTYTGCSDITYVVPCFYKEKSNVVEHFGHGRFYRIAYDLNIKDHLPESLKRQSHIVDLTDSILGYADNWAGRVSFSEARLGNKPMWCEASLPHPLMSPKPTSFQFYLEQNMDSLTSNYNHWGMKTGAIRGYKLYWHQPLSKANAWKIGKEDPVIKNSKYIQPIDSNMNFSSRVYFNDLSEVELGALLFSLSLDSYASEKQSISYKLGMGKSIGLGSIKLTYSLHIQDKSTRYKTLFDNDKWQLGSKDTSKDRFIQAFIEYRTEKLGVECSSYSKMIEDLLLMMDWNLANGPTAIRKWGEAMTMMSIDNDPHKRFKDRSKLGTPSEFLKAWSKK